MYDRCQSHPERLLIISIPYEAHRLGARIWVADGEPPPFSDGAVCVVRPQFPIGRYHADCLVTWYLSELSEDFGAEAWRRGDVVVEGRWSRLP